MAVHSHRRGPTQGQPVGLILKGSFTRALCLPTERVLRMHVRVAVPDGLPVPKDADSCDELRRSALGCSSH